MMENIYQIDMFVPALVVDQTTLFYHRAPPHRSEKCIGPTSSANRYFEKLGSRVEQTHFVSHSNTPISRRCFPFPEAESRTGLLVRVDGVLRLLSCLRRLRKSREQLARFWSIYSRCGKRRDQDVLQDGAFCSC